MGGSGAFQKVISIAKSKNASVGAMVSGQAVQKPSSPTVQTPVKQPSRARYSNYGNAATLSRKYLLGQ